METKKNNIEFIPKFEKSFLLPRYWGAWLGVFAFAGIALTPPSFRDPILGKLGRFVGRLAKSSRRRAQINLLYCFPEKSEFEREAIIDAMYASAPQAMVMMAELGLRDPQKILARVDWQGKAIIDEMQRNNEKVIFLVPHAWGVDIPAMLMASGGQKMAAMFHNQGNPVFDYAVVSVDVCTRATTASNPLFSRYVRDTGATICRIRITAPNTASLWISLPPTRPRCRRLAA